MKHIISSLFLSMVLSTLATPVFAKTIYVTTTGSDTASGTTWAKSYKTVTKAISVAVAGNEIWIAAGTYKEGTSLKMKEGVAIRGGFAGTETSVNQRVSGENETILDGNKSHRLFHNDFKKDAPLSGSAVLDTITIANGKVVSADGGGMRNAFASPTVINCTFRGNEATFNGGGMQNFTSAPTVTNCTFIGNKSGYGYGGGIYIGSDSAPNITNCTFTENTAELGGGLYTTNSTPIITNCTISGNTATENGGGFYNYNFAKPIITNCTISGNTAVVAGGIFNRYHAAPTLTNCILWDNSGEEIRNEESASAKVNYCVVKGGYSGTGNITTNPLLLPLDYYGYGGVVKTMPVKEGSSAIGKGATQTQALDGVTIPKNDAIGNLRNTAVASTIGAVEYYVISALTAVGTYYSEVIPPGSDMYKFSAKGLPKGLKIDAKGIVSGIPKKAGTYIATITITEKADKKNKWTETLVINVAPIAPRAVGTFTGYFYSWKTIYGTWKLTVSKNGKISAQVVTRLPDSNKITKISFKAKSWLSVATSDIYKTTIVKIDKKSDMSAYKQLEFSVDTKKNWEAFQAQGELTLYGTSVITYTLDGQRNVWVNKKDAEYDAAFFLLDSNYIGNFKGKWTVVLSEFYKKWMGMKGHEAFVGEKYINITVGKTGIMKYSGKLADGTKFSGTTTLLNYTEYDTAIFPVYALPKGKSGTEAYVLELVED